MFLFSPSITSRWLRIILPAGPEVPGSRPDSRLTLLIASHSNGQPSRYRSMVGCFHHERCENSGRKTNQKHNAERFFPGALPSGPRFSVAIHSTTDHPDAFGVNPCVKFNKPTTTSLMRTYPFQVRNNAKPMFFNKKKKKETFLHDHAQHVRVRKSIDPDNGGSICWFCWFPTGRTLGRIRFLVARISGTTAASRSWRLT